MTSKRYRVKLTAEEREELKALTLISHNGWLGCDVCACKLLMQRSWLGFAGGKGMVAGCVRVGRKRGAFGAGCDAGGSGADL